MDSKELRKKRLQLISKQKRRSSLAGRERSTTAPSELNNGVLGGKTKKKSAGKRNSLEKRDSLAPIVNEMLQGNNEPQPSVE